MAAHAEVLSMQQQQKRTGNSLVSSHTAGGAADAALHMATAATTGNSNKGTRHTRPSQPPRALRQDDLLRLLAEAFSAMMLRSSGQESSGEGRLSDAEVEVWLRQLLTLSRSEQGSSTVLELHGALRERHAWLKLGDVYSALVALRDRYGL
jgi:hypothetical protein